MVLLTTWPAITDDSGTKQDGTIFNKTLTDAMKAAIETSVHSTTNPTVTPEDIIDEVVTARGSKATLDTRLDVSMNEDGTMKANASNFSTANYQSGLGSRNVALNGDFNYWTLGSALAPDDWTLSSGSVAQCGTGMADTTTLGAGTFCAKITRAGAVDGNLTQTIISIANMAAYAEVRSKTVAVAAKIKTSTVNAAKLALGDGSTTTESSYHTGGGTVEHLTLVKTIGAAAPGALSLALQVVNTDSTAYFGGIAVVFAEVAPSDWQPYSREPRGTGVIDGLVSTVDQSITGVKSFASAMLFKGGSESGTTAKVIGAMSVQGSIIGNVGAGEDVLVTYTLPGGSLDATTTIIRITAGWNSAANANNKTVKVYFGATALVTSSTAGHNAEGGRAQIEVARINATSQRAVGELKYGATDDLCATTTPGETLANDIVIKITGTATSDNDIVGRYLIVEILA